MKRLLAALFIGLLALTLGACDPFGDDDDDDDDDEQPAAAEGETQEEDTGGEEDTGAGGGNTLDEVLDRGVLRCGVNDQVPGFGFLNPEGDFEGFDIDFCRALAAAVFGDPEAVEFTATTAETRFEVLSAGEVDVLIRNSTWTISRDSDLDLTFTNVNFYDGQGMMVREGEFASIDEMEGAIICVTQGTTTEQNLADRFEAAGLSFTPLTFETNEDLQPAFLEGRCDGWTSDKSQLAGLLSAFPDPNCCVVLEETFSKEPLGPVTREGDEQWADIVRWVVNGMIIAEELGITSQNIDDFLENPGNPEVARLLGIPFAAEEGGPEEVFDPGLGLEPTFMQEVIRQVGNYGEVYARHLEEAIPLPREGTLNALWIDGGLMYSAPWR
jgi:general L-amino acid transport system substrate-binding protein